MSSDDGVNKRLDRSWYARDETDSVLDLLAVVSKGLPVAVGMLIDGRVIRGVLTDADVMTEAATTAIKRPLQAFGADWEEESKKSIAEAFTRQAKQRTEQAAKDRAVADKYFDTMDSFGIDDIQADDLPSFYAAVSAPATVTVRQATIELGVTVATVDALSVQRKAISAWWFLDSEDGPLVNYVPPQP